MTISQRNCAALSKTIALTPGLLIKPCCAYTGSLGELNSVDDLFDTFTSEQPFNIKKQFSQDKFPSGCQQCLRNEEAHLVSHRMKMNKRYANDLSVKKNKLENLEGLDIIFSDLCNLDCAFCSSEYSSKWKKHAGSLTELGFNQDIPTVSDSRSIPNLSAQQWQSFFEKLPSLKQIDIKGGEPTFFPGFQNFLQGLLLAGRTDVTVSVVTNGTMFSEDFFSKVSQLPRIQFIVSIDGEGSVYEYIRGTSFDEMESKLKSLVILPGARDQVFNFTVCNLNVLNIENFCIWFEKLTKENLNKKYILGFNQVVRDPIFLSPWVLPKRDRLLAVEAIRRVLDKRYPFINSSELTAIVNALEKPPNQGWEELNKKFFKYIKFFNSLRKNSFESLNLKWKEEASSR